MSEMADHPGMHTPGEPGTVRYLCPFCDWFYDQAEGFGAGLFVGIKDLSALTDPIIEAHLADHVEEMTHG